MKKWVIILIIVLVVLAAVIGSVYYNNKVNNKEGGSGEDSGGEINFENTKDVGKIVGEKTDANAFDNVKLNPFEKNE